MVYSLVHFRLVVQNHKGLGGCSVAVENETEVPTLTLHISEVYESGVKSKFKERREMTESVKIGMSYFLDLKQVLDLDIQTLSELRFCQ